MSNEFNEEHPFGSSRLAAPEEVSRAGMLVQQPDSLFTGFLGKSCLWYSGMGGALLVAGGRSGKMATWIAFNICSGILAHSLLMLDMTGEGFAISQDQTPDGKFCIGWNPLRLHNLPSHRINPVDHLHMGSPTLVSDIKAFCLNMIVSSGGENGEFFAGRAREFLEAIVLTLVRMNGVLTFPDLYRALNRLVGGGDAWLDFAFEMSESEFDHVQRIEQEVASARSDTSGGYKGIVGELMKAFACLSDPVLMESVSPPFDFSTAQLCESDQAYQLYLMCPPEFVTAWAPVLKAIFINAKTYKSRAPGAPRQTWILDECAQLTGWPLAVDLFSIGAGIGIRPVAVFQSAKQMKALGPDAETIITSSAALQCWFGVRDLDTATMLSRRMGMETLAYIDRHRQAEALHAKRRAALALLQGDNPFRAGVEYSHYAQTAHLPVLKQRPLFSPDELLGMAPDKMLVFTDGIAHPIFADRRNYYDVPFMTGRFHPNPYYPPLDRVRVKTRHGYAWRRVVVERVPRQFAHYPQYADGFWSRIR